MRELIHRPSRAPSKCRHFLVVELQPFSLRKDTKIEIFGGKMTHVPSQTTSFLAYFPHSSGFFPPWERPEFVKKSHFLDETTPAEKTSNRKKRQEFYPFFVSPGDESSLVRDLRIRPLLLVEDLLFWDLKCGKKSTSFFQFLDYSAWNLRSPP